MNSSSPLFPAELTLETSLVLLRPLQETDYPVFLELARLDPDMFFYFSLNLSDPDQLTRWFEIAMRERNHDVRRPFTIIDKRTGQLTGSSSLGNISIYDKRVEIGWSWLAKPFRGTGINVNAKFAMMHYAFETAGMERVEFKTDVQNTRARRGLEKIGGTEEGVLRSHMTMWNHRRRSSVFYSVLRNEWPEVKSNLIRDFEIQ